MEEVEVVDEHDNVIGKIDKSKADASGLIHRVVAVFVFTPDGKLYLQEHIKSGGMYDHSIGGHVKKGEGYKEAAVREAEEELGLIDSLKKISVVYSDETLFGSKTKHMFAIFECTPSESWHFIPNEEVKNIFPLTLEETVNLMNKNPKKFTPGFLNTMREYIKRKQLPFTLSRF